MSEIFRYLDNNREPRRRAARKEAIKTPVNFEARPEEPESGERAVVPVRANFKLNLADHRISVVLNPMTPQGEQFRYLRHRLDQMQRKDGIKTLLVTSSLPGEGKTFAACCLAGTLAQEPGKRVLLMEGDLRKPKAAANIGAKEAGTPEGLSGILAGSAELEDALMRCETLDFFFLPAGPVPQNPSELLASMNLEKLIQRAGSLFDWVVIDSTPVLVLADATRLAPLCDTVLMVVQANLTPAKVVNKALQLVGRERVAGLILNRVRDHISSRYYYRSKGSSKKGQKK